MSRIANNGAERMEREQASNSFDIALTRRNAVRALLGAAGAAVLLGSPIRAFAEATASDETLNALSDAQAQYEAAQAKLDSIASQYQTLAEQQDKTMSQIEDVQSQIDATQAKIDKKQKQLDKRQGELGERVSSSYKNGGISTLMLLLNSSSFEELVSNSHYVDKINDSDKAVIEDVRRIKEELSSKKTELESQKSDLEALKETQTQQLNDMQAKQQEASNMVSSLSDEVQQLIAQRDSEILAAAQEEAQQQAAAAAAAAAAASSSSSSSSSSTKRSSGTTGTTPTGDSATGSAAKVVAACKSVPSPGSGLCAMWVSQVFNAAGLGYIGGNACDMYNSYCTSSDRSAIKPGMIVAVSSWPGTSAGKIYGHVGIYIGNGTVMDNIGSIRTTTLDSWVSSYCGYVTPRWGWLGGISLS